MPLPPPPPPIPPTFHTLKTRILTSLSVPSPSYTDASPKGTLDTAIVPLIERLNALEGVVSTSSCAGRISVFLEGRKKAEVRDQGDGRWQEGGDGDQVAEVGDDDDDGEAVRDEEGGGGGRVEKKKGVPGGKGLGGRWLFVSHERAEMPEHNASGRDDEVGGGLTKLFGLTRPVTFKRNEDGRGRRSSDAKNARFVRFAFEPMVSLTVLFTH